MNKQKNEDSAKQKVKESKEVMCDIPSTPPPKLRSGSQNADWPLLPSQMRYVHVLQACQEPILPTQPRGASESAPFPPNHSDERAHSQCRSLQSSRAGRRWHVYRGCR